MPAQESSLYPSFAAFIMTYERPQILLDTLSRIQEQTFAPSCILIVDNSVSHSTETAVKELQYNDVRYYRVGYNSGPAGAAKIGLEKLTALGYEWIYWGDDDNPPVESTTFENLFKQLKKIKHLEKIGVLGGKGGLLNPWTGRIETFSNSDLLKREILEVDMVPGGGTLLVNAEVVKQQVLPLEKLFFGFEELDFCLRVQKAGFKNIVITKHWLQENYRLGYNATDYRWKDSYFGKEEFLWRSYYSTRNLLYVLFKNDYFAAFLFLMFKSILKSLIGFRFGSKYGKRNFSIQWKAINHFLTGSFGRHNFEEN